MDNYFRLARGRSVQAAEPFPGEVDVAAGEMTKWFDTNYHYLVPEFERATTFDLDASRLLAHIEEVRRVGVKVKPG